MGLLTLFTKLLPIINGTANVLAHGWRSKTVIFGALLVLFSGIQSILPDVAMFLGPYGPVVTGVIGLIVIILRAVTNQPLAEKAPDSFTNRGAAKTEE